MIGNGFLVLASLVQWTIGRIYVFGFSLRRLIYSQLLSPAMFRYIPKLLGRRWLPRWLLVGIQEHVDYYYRKIYDEKDDIYRCMGVVTTRLLEKKYAIKDEDTGDVRLWIFYSTLAKATKEEARGNPLMLATQAIGWSGLVATRLASTLTNRYYISFSVLMIVSGWMHDFYLARRYFHPIANSLGNLRALLRELKEPGKADAPNPETAT